MTITLHINIIVLAILIREIDMVFDFVGTIGSSCIGFVFPGIGYLAALHRYGSEKKKA